MNGLVETRAESEQFFSIEERADLFKPELQAMLRRAHGGRYTLRCACCGGNGQSPRVASRAFGRVFWPMRLRTGEHSEDCWSNKCFKPPSMKPYSSGIFSKPRFAELTLPVLPAEPRTSPAQDASRFEPLTFSAFCERVFSEAFLQAALTGSGDVRLPTFDDFRRHLRERLCEARFDEEGLDAFGACEKRGTNIRLGLFLDRPYLGARSSGDRLVKLALGKVEDVQLMEGSWLVETLVLERGCQNVATRSGHIAPPWLALVLVEPDGRIRRLCAHAVWFDPDGSIVPVESNAERQAAARLHRSGSVFFKPMGRDDLRQLLRGARVEQAEWTIWDSRPDFLIWHGRRQTPIATVVELRGFAAESLESYDHDFELKKNRYLGCAPAFGFLEVCATELRAEIVPPSTSRNYWEFVRPGCGISPAAEAWISKKMHLISAQSAPTPPLRKR